MGHNHNSKITHTQTQIPSSSSNSNSNSNPTTSPLPRMAAQDAQPFHWHYPDLDDNNFQLHGHALLLLLVVFALILFVSLICLYARWWACRRALGRPTGLGLGQDRPNHQLGPSGLDPGLITSLPVLLHRQAAADDSDTCAKTLSSEEEDSTCSICLSIFVDGEKVKLLPNCGHLFHPECIDEWLRKRTSCPMCRAYIGDLHTAEHDGGSPV